MKIRVVSVIVDTKQVTLYKEDGKTVFIPQGDPRVRRIIDEALPIIQTGQIAIVDLTEANAYHDFEKAGTGKVSFWRVAKSKLAGLFGREAPKSMVETQDEINQTLQLTEKMIVAKKNEQDAEIVSRYAIRYRVAGEYPLRPGVDLILLVRRDIADPDTKDIYSVFGEPFTITPDDSPVP